MRIENLSDNASNFTGNIWKLENRETCLIDVGTGDSWNSVKRLETIEKVVITHSHYDHIDNLSKVVEKFSPAIYAFEPSNLPVKAEKISEKDKISLSGLEFQALHTPGHKNDSICLYNAEKGILFTGDLIFPDAGYGRTDLAEGDRDALIKSIKKITGLKVMSFYPGHGNAVTKDAEKWVQKSLENAQKREPKY